MAQEQTWYPGVVVTTDLEVITGHILYQNSFELVVIRGCDEQMAQVRLASQLKSFRFYDQGADINRKFVIIDKSIFEEVVPGLISVVRKAKPLAIARSDREGYDYYFLRDDRLERLEKFRAKLYPKISGLMMDEENELRLNPNNTSDAIRYIQLYNKKQSTRNWMAVRY